ncbi:MAG: hypothetical protein IT449_03715 [Phycisphaerales bacterium]|nr:hypothetical protein [Phycisphaerales bacterium]
MTGWKAGAPPPHESPDRIRPDLRMMLGISDEWLGLVTPLAGAMLSVVVFYLRSMREHQLTQHAELVRRLDRVEDETRRLARCVREMERALTTKEEWLRESMSARRRLDALTQAVGKLRVVGVKREGQ